MKMFSEQLLGIRQAATVLALALFWSVALLALRIDRLTAEGSLVVGASREVMFLVNNLLFVLFTFTVLTGTTFPLIVYKAVVTITYTYLNRNYSYSMTTIRTSDI